MQISFTSKNKIKYDLLKSDQKIDINNNEMLFEYYQFMIRLRHDILHYVVLDSFGREWSDEKSFKMYFELHEDHNPLLDKTPDIIQKYENKYYIIDVSISRDIHTTAKQKKDKYEPVVNYISRITGLQLFFIHINVQTSMTNLERELEKVSFLFKKSPEIHFYNECVTILEDKKRYMSQYMDKEYFEKRKTEIFSSDELKHEKYGLSGDLEIDHDVFVNFNSKFNIQRNVGNNIETFDEEKFCVKMKEVLEDQNSSLYNKYKDDKCTETQFIDAFNTIKKKNESAKQNIPKPTHHVLIPFYEEDTIKISSLNEQTQTIEFFDFLRKTTFENTDSKLTFLLELGNKHNDLFKGHEKDLNNCCYNTGTYCVDGVNLTSIYKILKKLTCVYKYKYMNQKLTRKDKLELQIFKHNKEQRIEELLKQYNEYGKKYNTTKFRVPQYSFRTFLQDYLGYDLAEEYVLKQKTIKLSKKCCSTEFFEYWKKTGINVSKNQPDVTKWDVSETIPFDCMNSITKTIEVLIQPCKQEYKEDQFFDHYYTYDSEYANMLKKEMTDAYKPLFQKLHDTKTFNYLRNSHFVTQQLLHFSLLNLKPMSFSIFNAGIPNTIYIVAGCYNKLFSEDGKPFMCVTLTKNPQWYTDFFGKYTTIKCQNSDYYLLISNWRRLPTSKLTHMRDSYYSVLSSTMNSMLSNNNYESVVIPKKYEYIFALRAIISLSTNQKIAEFLMDARYAYMSAFATHTNINKLLVEKFGPPYRTSFEVWIVNRLLTRLHVLFNHVNNENIKLKRPEYHGGIRANTSIGGEIQLPSLWGNYLLLDVSEILDEAFIYVHTMKEPSNIFHEQIKAMDVIVTFQNEYDSLPNEIKYGNLSDWEEIYKYLMRNTKIGFSGPIIYKSVKYTVGLEKPNIKRFVDEINNEPIGELISTKAVINDIEREIIESEKLSSRQIGKHMKKMREFLTEEEFENNKNDIKHYYLKTHSKYYSEMKPRQKVIETVLDNMMEDLKLQRTIDLANKFIKNDDGHVVADICIKAQYGSKREFYVINIGAKGLARCTENFFKKMSENSPNEAISIPGDKKILEMQRMLDRIFMSNPLSEKLKLKYVNGDCTKWSAAETMGSFLSMTMGLKDQIPPMLYQLLLATFNSWSEKDIQVPIDIFNKVIPPTLLKYKTLVEKLKYLTTLEVKQKGRFHSTQNFLQGMFNYASSYKAVCCANYTYKIWKKIYPEKRFFMEHLEHSDDYVMVILYEDECDFEKFRVLHKIMMRLHGFNDSERKTNCQSTFMEFVSQLSFNGVTMYPQIKKSKEVNLSLPCVGYKQDVDAAYSRIGECMRVGCNQTFLYFYQRLHMICVAEAYSLLPGMQNEFGTFKELLNKPIEFFGIPDMLPLFSLFCKGCGNNYRLWKYGDDICKNKILFLYREAKKIIGEEEFMSENLDYTYSLSTPKFLYDTNNKGIAKLQSVIKWGPDDLKNFWSDHISYKFLKPKNNILLINWIKSMFFNRSFLEAYTKASRTKMTMRISHFVRAKAIKLLIKVNELFNKYDFINQNVYTIKEYQNYLEMNYKEFVKKQNISSENNNNIIEEKVTNEEKLQILKIITKCDATYSAIYSILDNMRISKRFPRKRSLIQVATKVPAKVTSFTIVNDPGILLQYLYNEKDFHIDDRKYISLQSLEQDVYKLKERVPEYLLKSKNTMDILSVFNDIAITKDKQLIMMGHDKTSKQLIYVIEDIMRFNFYPFFDTNTIINDVIHVVDPFTNKILFSKGHKITPDLYQQNIENICLIYTYFSYKEKMDNRKIKQLLSNSFFQISEGEYVDYKEILNHFTPTYCEQFEVPLEIQKMCAYLAAILLGNNELLDHIVDSIYSYSYRYDIRGEYYSGRYHGTTVGYFTNFRKICKFIQTPENKIYLLCESPKPGMFIIQYNIALKLVGELSEELFNNTMYKNRLQNIDLGFKTQEEFKSFLKKEKIVGLYQIREDHFKYVNSKEAIYTDLYIPIFRTLAVQTRGFEQKQSLRKLSPSINEEKLSVYVGKEKVYMLPFWKCKTYNTLMHEKKVFESYNISILFDDRIIQYFLTNKEIINVLEEIPHPDDIEDILLEYIHKNRLYTFIDDKLFGYLTKNINNNSVFNYMKKIFLKDQPQELTPSLDQLHFKTQQKSLLENEEELPIETAQDLSKVITMTDFDFLMEENEEEFGLLEEEEVQDIQITVKAIPTKEFSISELLVEKPTELRLQRQKQLQRQNYLLKLINNKLPINIQLLRNKYISNQQSKTLNLCEYLEGIKSHFERYEILQKNHQYKNYSIKKCIIIFFI
jgi:hypothetical protein